MTNGTRLQGKVALITGAGSGIGRESSLLWASEGASIVAVDIDQASAQHTADAVRAAGGRGVAVQADVARAQDCERMIAAAESEFGTLNILFNNAGIMHSQDDDAVSTDEAVWDVTMNINAKGVFFGCKYGIPALRRAVAARSSTPRPSWRCWARRRRRWPTRPARVRCWR